MNSFGFRAFCLVNQLGKGCNIHLIGSLGDIAATAHQNMGFTSATSLIAGVVRGAGSAATLYEATRSSAAVVFSVAAAILYRGSRQDIYNVLWAVVFGFATLNILTLAGRRLEPSRRGLTFGELMAVMVVIISVILLGWEMLGFLHIFPIRLRR